MAYLRACEVRQLLYNKFVVVMGDSVQRSVYKDLVLLLQKDCLLSSSQLKAKGELSFERDMLLEGGRRGRMHNGTHYREVREFRSGHHLVRFYFLTRVYSQYVEDVLEELRRGEYAPDVVVMNSCLWDLSRYGQDSWRSYRENLESVFRRLSRVLPPSCLLVWNTAMPVAETVSGGFLPPEREPRAARLREDVVEANFYSSMEASRRGFDVLDLHFHFRHAWQHRQRDGVHWDERAHRHLSQLLLAHLADAWGVDLPCRPRVGRWIRDGPARGHQEGAAGREPQDSRDESTESAGPSLPSSPTSLGSRRRPALPRPQARPRNPQNRQGTSLTANQSPQGPPVSEGSSSRQTNDARESYLMVGRHTRVGRNRRISDPHGDRLVHRGSPPYPSRHSHPSGRRHRRHSDRSPGSDQRQSLRSHT